MRALGSAPRASRASTSGSRSSSRSRSPRARAPPCLRFPGLSARLLTEPAAACSAVDAVDRPIGIGALRQQEVGERALPDDDRVGQRMRAIGSGVVDARSPPRAGPGAVSMSPFRAAAISGENACRGCGCTSAPRSTSVRTTSRCRPATGPHQRRLVGGGGGGVDLGAAGQQGPHDIQTARARGRHQRRQSVRLRPRSDSPPPRAVARPSARSRSRTPGRAGVTP